jgi:hypothetical protein
VGVPPLKPSGLKRTRSVLLSSSAVLALGAPRDCQVLPPSVEYCQPPVAPPLVAPVMATPWTALVSTSVIALPSRLERVWPALLAASSLMLAKLAGVPSTGASLTAVTAIVAVSVAVE